MINDITKIPKPTLKRLIKYYQYLNSEPHNAEETISCTDIAIELNLTSIQIRKDLQLAGAQGKPKIGYSIDYLIEILTKCLGYDNINDAFLVGAGNFGKLILNYKGFDVYGLNILAAFDRDEALIGKGYNGVKILNVNKFKDLAQRMKTKIGIVAVDTDNAQQIADMMIDSGIEAIWNLTHANISVPEDIIKVDVNLGSSLSVLLSQITNKYNKH